MSKNDYDIDDILLEAQRLKDKTGRAKVAGAAPRSDDELELAVDLAREIMDEQTAQRGAASKGKRQEKAIPQPPKERETLVEKRPRKAEKLPQLEPEPAPEPEKKKTVYFRRKETPETVDNLEEEIFSFRSGAPAPLDHRVAGETAPLQPIPPQSRPGKGKRGRQAPQEGAGGAKLDLFAFQPERREGPIRTGPFGEKHFDFRKSKPAAVEPPPKAPLSEKRQAKNPRGFDFDAISGRIDQLQVEEEKRNQSVRTNTSPLEFTGQIDPLLLEKMRGNRGSYSGLVFGEGPPTKAPRGKFDFNVGKTGRPTPTPKGEEEEPEEGRKSLFSTFATGTGRELKIEDIRKIDFGAVEGSGSGYYDDEEYYFGEDLPDGSYVDIGEYGPKSNRRDVAREILSTKLSTFVRTALTGLLVFILFYLGLSAKHKGILLPKIFYPEKSTLGAFLTLNTLLTALVGVICGTTMISGIVSAVKMKANSDTLAAFAILGAVFQGVQVMRFPESFDPAAMTLYFPVAALAMLFNCVGKLTMLDRISQNFKITAANMEKFGVLAVQAPGFTRELLPKQTHQRPTIAYSARADFFTDYMALSFSNKYDVGINRSVAPVCLIGAIIVGIATRFLAQDSATAGTMAATAFAGVLCICATFSSTFIENIPLGKMSRKLLPMGAMVSGNKAVESFCDTNAVVLSEKDLFPKGHVYLNGIKAFPNGRIDEAILDAASVLCALGGSLSFVFLDMIGGNRQLLKKVDNVVYENGMGLSGWVDGRRVLIGNRMLMQNHGVQLPADSYERAHPKDTPGNPIYLSNTGEVSARFLVQYVIDEELAYQLDLFAAKDKQLIIYTTDANIDASKIWELYGYPLDLVTIMPSELQDDFRVMAQPREETPAEIVYTGKPASFVAAILATINARASILSATVVQLAQIILGYGLVALMAFMGYIGQFSMVKMTLYQLFWFAAILVIQQSRRP